MLDQLPPQVFRLAVHRAVRALEQPGDVTVDSLVGALRGGDWIVVRSAGRLVAWDVDAELGDPGYLRPLGGDGENLLSVALGDRHIVARRILGGGEEELVLIPVNPSRRNDVQRVGDAITLARKYEELGHPLYAAKLWSLSGEITLRFPGITAEDRKEAFDVRPEWPSLLDPMTTTN